MIKRLSTVVLLAALFCAPMASAEFQLKDTDRVVFLGDSWVSWDRRGGFVHYLETFVRARYPQLKTRFINPRTHDRTVREALSRVEGVLKPSAPTIVVMLFGSYEPGNRRFDESDLDEFRRDYAAVVDAIQQIPSGIILVTPPSPATHRSGRSRVPGREDIAARYAAAVRALAGERQLPLVDWFELTAAEQQDTDPNSDDTAAGQRELRPETMHAMLAAQLLKHWQAEPIKVDVQLDWLGDAAAISSGTIRIARRTDQELSVEIRNAPLPWALPAMRARTLDEAAWPGADLCQYMLKVENPPPEGLELVLGERQLALETAALRAGVNMTGWDPIQNRNPALRTLDNYIAKKFKWQKEYWEDTLPRKPREPELHEAFEAYCHALQLWEEGTVRVIQHLPVTFDVLLLLRARQVAGEPPPAHQPASAEQEDQP